MFDIAIIGAPTAGATLARLTENPQGLMDKSWRDHWWLCIENPEGVAYKCRIGLLGLGMEGPQLFAVSHDQHWNVITNVII